MTTPPNSAAAPAGAPHELVNAFLDGELSEGQGRELSAWLQADPEHLRYFVRETHAHHALHEMFVGELRGRASAEVIIENTTATASNPHKRRTPLHASRAVRSPKGALWRNVGLGVAAAAMLSLGGWWYLATRYPAPAVQGQIQIVGDGTLTRGAEVQALAADAKLNLGGYCNVAMDAHSTVRWEGAEKAEAIYLTQGGVECEVDRHVGTFTVNSDVGSVSVTGTRFTVKLVPPKGVQPMRGKAMAFLLAVSVTAGSVNVNYDGKTTTLHVGQSQVFGAENPPPPPPPPPKGDNNVRPYGPGPNHPPGPPPNTKPNQNPPPQGDGDYETRPTPPHPMGQNGDGPQGPPPGEGPGQGPNQNPGQGPGEGPGGDPNKPKGPPPPLLAALDTDHDGELSAEEIAAAVESLKKLDKNGDGKIDKNELRPPPPPPQQGGKPGENNQGGSGGGAGGPPQGGPGGDPNGPPQQGMQNNPGGKGGPGGPPPKGPPMNNNMRGRMNMPPPPPPKKPDNDGEAN